MVRKIPDNEFDLIARHFAPLSRSSPGAFGLLDDAAFIPLDPRSRLLVSADTLIEGVHFFPDDLPQDIARKILRVNLSDMAAMGARPRSYLLMLSLPARAPFDDSWLSAFSDGLREDQERYGIYLAGGDTTAMPGPLTLSLTILGEVTPPSAILRRADAREGHLVAVSGTIGDAALGLLLRRGEIRAATDLDRSFLLSRYLTPEPRLALGLALSGSGHNGGKDGAGLGAVIDVSDGLVADLGHICQASGLGAEIEAAAVPLSSAARSVLAAAPQLHETVLTGGDDYELLFTFPPERKADLALLGREAGVSLSVIGRMTASPGIKVLDSGGGVIKLSRQGYTHF